MEASGNPPRLHLSGGECHDSPHAPPLIEGYEARVLIADTGSDSGPPVASVRSGGMLAMVPPKKNRLERREYDRHLCRERHLVECFINKVRRYGRIFSRFEKLSKNYPGFLSFVNALVWLR